MLTRRSFLKQAGGAVAAISGLRLISGCTADPLAHIKGGITGANHKTGHLLRQSAQLPGPSEKMEADVVIVGGGVSGLSARSWLGKHADLDVVLLEMDQVPGGNSRYGKNGTSAYPYGAHYLPVPDLRNKELISFLHACGSITGFDQKGLPVYNEYHLCHDPEERLFINGYWQEGLVPEVGIADRDRQEIRRFFAEIATWKEQKGSDGKDVFTIPVEEASSDRAYVQLHDRSFAAYLKDQGFSSKPLLWYLEYCCKDDYGGTLDDVSAWAGLHYFAARKGAGSNATSASVLTWPEGNGFLMEALKREGRGAIRTDMLAFSVERTASGATVSAYDVARGKSIVIAARYVVMATPVSVSKRLLRAEGAYSQIRADLFQRAPWVVANLTINGLPAGKGAPLSWDNVLYGTGSVGYVNANQQDLNQKGQKVITWYMPLTGKDTDAARKIASQKDFRHWLSLAIQELSVAHPDIARYVRHADIWVWGHGMIRPSPGFFTSEQRRIASEAIDNIIFFAHTDLSGISIFEEGFYQGIEAAKQILSVL